MTVDQSPVKILHLEDDDNDAELLGSVIVSALPHAHVVRVNSKHSYVEALGGQPFDLILSDYTIPGFSGMDALELARSVTPETPFIFLSGTLGEESAVETIVHGATDYVLKHRPARLPLALQRALTESEMRRQQMQTRERERFQSNVLRHVTDGIIVTNTKGEITFWNRGATRILDVPLDQALGIHIGSISLGDGLDTLTQIFDRATDSGEAAMDFACRTATGKELWLRSKATQIRADDQTPLARLVVLTDITDRKRAEDEILRINATLEKRVEERTQALAAANDELKSFAYRVSHDLSGPLRAIAGYSYMLREDFEAQLGDEGRRLIERISKAVKRMDQLIQGLLELSTLMRSDLDRSEVDLSSLFEGIASDLVEAHPARQIDIVVEPKLVAYADPRLIRSVLLNLLGNALKFTSKREQAIISFGATEQGERTVYFVRDNGVGFEQRDAPSIFKVFARLHSEDDFPGTGIGLATVQSIIHRHGGEIWAEGQPGEGATFYFTLQGRDGADES